MGVFRVLGCDSSVCAGGVVVVSVGAVGRGVVLGTTAGVKSTLAVLVDAMSDVVVVTGGVLACWSGAALSVVSFCCDGAAALTAEGGCDPFCPSTCCCCWGGGVRT